MDYGHTSQTNNNGDYLATNSDAYLESSQNNNLDKPLDSPVERNQRAIGDKVMNGSRENNLPEREAPSVPEYGEIIDLNLPPNSTREDSSNMDPAKVIEASFDRTAIKTGDKINPDALKEINKATSRLDQTGNIADFYDTIRDAMEVNLDNSYGRKLAT